MARIITLDIPHQHYTADACVVWCFDDRFTKLLENLASRKKFKYWDLIKVAGGAKGLADDNDAASRAYALDQIEKSIKLHKTTVVYLMVHANCGAYGDKGFASTDDEAQFFKAELLKAENALKNYFAPKGISLDIKKVFADFEGLSEA